MFTFFGSTKNEEKSSEFANAWACVLKWCSKLQKGVIWGIRTDCVNCFFSNREASMVLVITHFFPFFRALYVRKVQFCNLTAAAADA